MKAILTILAAIATLPAWAADTVVPYPEGYRTWTHVKSMVIEEGHPLYASFGGIHHIYANAKAMKGYRAGRFPDGAVIVFDLLEAPRADSAVTEGARKVAGVMHKDEKASPKDIGSQHCHRPYFLTTTTHTLGALREI